MEEGGVIVDYHGADLFPERWFDLVVVLRADNGVLYSRLESRRAPLLPCAHGQPLTRWPRATRDYSQKKLQENMEAEIMQVILDEAREAYREEIVIELTSDSVEALEMNVQRMVEWVEQFVSRAAQPAPPADESSQPPADMPVE